MVSTMRQDVYLFCSLIHLKILEIRAHLRVVPSTYRAFRKYKVNKINNILIYSQRCNVFSFYMMSALK